MPIMVMAQDQDNKKNLEQPTLTSFQLGSSETVAEKQCRKIGGKWLESRLNLFSCNANKFRASIETNAHGNVSKILVTFKDVSGFNKELGKFNNFYPRNKISSAGANNTLINEFVTDDWAAIFMSYGENGNYSVTLYSIKDLLNK